MKTQIIALTLIASLSGIAAGAEDAYKRAVLNYQAHKYSAALSDFEKLAAAYPSNAMVRYYRALCYQGTNQMSLAKKDFEWVAAYCPDAKIKQMGAAGLRNLGGYRSQVSSSSNSSFSASSAGVNVPSVISSAGVNVPGGTQSPVASAASSSPGSKLSKVIEFTSQTCPTCITFAPIFEQTRGRFPGLDMQQLDVADPGNASLVSQYSVKNYPTIVFLSNSGQVLFQRAGAPTTTDQFAQLIARYK